MYRARATAGQLAASGWDVTVYTAPREFFTRYIGSVDPSLESGVDPRITIRRPSMDYFRWERDIRRYGRFRANMPVLANAGYNLMQRRFFPEHYASWIPRVVARALREHAGKRFDLILATGKAAMLKASGRSVERNPAAPHASRLAGRRAAPLSMSRRTGGSARDRRNDP